MIKISLYISGELSFKLEEFFAESANVNWGVDKLNNDTPPELFGYFEGEEEALQSFGALKKEFPELPKECKKETINPCDWQNEYKKYLQPWSAKNLHWVPVWDKENYKVPANGKVFYFDAGLAFGTGDHPTTRLCALRMLDYITAQKDFENKRLIDAGCGSGILAISAKLLGFKKVYGFDLDPEAVRVSKENAKFNNAQNILFERADLVGGLRGKTCDLLLVNIQADILVNFSSSIIAAVGQGGVLVLSGILTMENDEVKAHFSQACKGKIETMEHAVMGEWSDLKITFK